ncbi:MAG: hypothetical protein ABSC06_22955 [Rhodopila sp.]
MHWQESGITRYRDIMAVDTNHKAFSSDAVMGGIVLRDLPMDLRRPSFISMDPPKHDEQRRIVAPIVAPMNLARLSGTIRQRVGRILDDLPRNEILDQAVACFTELWHERVKDPPRPNLISMLAHGEATRDLPSRPHEFMGKLLLLIVGGNDTTRNSISGGLLALNQYSGPFRKPRENSALVTTYRPHPAAPTFIIRVRHPPLRRQPPRRDAVDHPVGGNPEARFPRHRGCWGTHPGLLQYPAVDQFVAGPYSSGLTGEQPCRSPATTASPLASVDLATGRRHTYREFNERISRLSVRTLTEDEVVTHCAASLARYKLPHSVVFTDALPRSTTGKVQKPTLRLVFGNV